MLDDSHQQTCAYVPRDSRGPGLGFAEVRKALSDQESPDLEALQAKLDRDYQTVMEIMRECHSCVDALETGMLRIHYGVMRRSYAVSSRIAPARAHAALMQMTEVISHFASVIGEEAAA